MRGTCLFPCMRGKNIGRTISRRHQRVYPRAGSGKPFETLYGFNPMGLSPRTRVERNPPSGGAFFQPAYPRIRGGNPVETVQELVLLGLSPRTRGGSALMPVSSEAPVYPRAREGNRMLL